MALLKWRVGGHIHGRESTSPYEELPAAIRAAKDVEQLLQVHCDKFAIKSERAVTTHFGRGRK